MEAFYNSITLPISYTYSSINSCSGSSNSGPGRRLGPGPYMECMIWSKLPVQLVDRVIVFLPPPAFFRARLVCKRWYSLLFSHTFLELYLQLCPRHHWFIFFKHRRTLMTYNYRRNDGNENSCEGYLFDPYEFAWYRLSFPLIPPNFSPASSSGGLICWASDDAGPKSLILCNPIIGSISQLPPTVTPRLFPAVGLTVGPTSIDITVAGDDLTSPFAVKNLTAEGFHIDGNGSYSIWATNSSLPRLCSLESGQMVLVQGKYYCMNYNPFSVLVHDMEANDWWKIQAPMRRFLRSPSLVESRGKLVLVAAVEKSKLNVPKSLRLWSLQSSGSTWVEIERMPHQVYAEFEEFEGRRGFDSVGHGDFIVVVIRNYEKALLFDIYTKVWQWIPPCPFIHAGCEGGDGELHGFPLEPRIATPVTGLVDQFPLSFQSFN